MNVSSVEDNEFYAELLSYDLLKHNHKATVFNSAEDCIIELDNNRPDVMIIDIHLRHGADEFAVLDRLNRTEGSNCKTIMLTSSSSMTIGAIAKKRGVDYFFTKSLDSGF